MPPTIKAEIKAAHILRWHHCKCFHAADSPLIIPMQQASVVQNSSAIIAVVWQGQTAQAWIISHTSPCAAKPYCMFSEGEQEPHLSTNQTLQWNGVSLGSKRASDWFRDHLTEASVASQGWSRHLTWHRFCLCCLGVVSIAGAVSEARHKAAWGSHRPIQ